MRDTEGDAINKEEELGIFKKNQLELQQMEKSYKYGQIHQKRPIFFKNMDLEKIKMEEE